jgi:hypothetical protein
MSLQDWANVSIILQAVFIPVSLVFVLFQLRKQIQLTRASNAQALVQISSPFNLLLIQDPKAVELWLHGAKRYEELGEVERSQYMAILTWWLLLHENIFHQRQMDLIEREMYDSWQRDLEYFIRHHRLETRWQVLRTYYHQDFSRHVDDLIEKLRTARPSGHSLPNNEGTSSAR